jgi:hypothetical protein
VLPWALSGFLSTVSLEAVDLGQLPDDAWSFPSSPRLDPGHLFAAPSTAYEEPGPGFGPWRYRTNFNFDFLFGVLVPLENREDFDVGGMIGGRFEGRVVDTFRLGFEVDGGFHDISSHRSEGDLFDSGTLSRAYFLFPISYDLPLAGPAENPLSLRLGVAPGVQLAFPDIDNDVFIFPSDTRLTADDFVAFDLRARLTLYLPVGFFWSFFAEVSYDWARGRATVREEVISGGTITVTKEKRTIDLSSVNFLFGFTTIF